jgi:cytochrome c oxidase assembly protein Cox11
MQNFTQSLTPEFFNLLIIVVVIIGIALAVVRLYQDFTRPPKYPAQPPSIQQQPDKDVQP